MPEEPTTLEEMYARALESLSTRTIGELAEYGKRVERERNALRAILAPLLDDPHEERSIHGFGADEGTDYGCRFCETESMIKRAWTGRLDKRGRKINEDADATPHKPDCPVLRRDALLGRD